MALALSSCTPPSIGIVGIERNADGSLDALIRLCRGSVNTLILAPVSSVPLDGGESDEWRSVEDVEAPLSPPLSADAQLALPFSENTLRHDVVYKLWAAGRDGNAFSGYFSAADLADLEAGQVLTWSSNDSESDFQLVSTHGFEAIADDFCAL